MLFNSSDFLIFFIFVFAFYFGLPSRFQWVVLLLASCVFYANFVPKYLLILFAIILIDYYAGIGLDKYKGGLRKAVLWVSIISNLSILVYFKYFNFIIGNLALFYKDLDGFFLHAILPIGLSFHVFQSLSYTIEVYRGRQTAERNLGIYAIYVLYFPQLVAGPIERPQNLLHQFHNKHEFSEDRWLSALGLILSGFFKKVVVADSLSLVVNPIFTTPKEYGSISFAIAVGAFGFQIYCDFSGYSDIARGVSRILGIELMLNFDRPYWSKSVSEFWRRWHISLSTWFRDYVYIPLGGRGASHFLSSRNILIVFILSGLWHGAQWSFMIWGFVHGIALSIENFFLKELLKRHSFIARLWTLFIVFYSWIFFRANSLSDAIYICAHFFTDATKGLENIKVYQFTEAYLFLLALLILEYLQEKFDLWSRIVQWPIFLRSSFLALCTILFLLLGQFGRNTFIYFQF
jgi:D-alanyl-lipoteichoic acid acyltransferase DltB (MBOAT superfamily)